MIELRGIDAGYGRSTVIRDVTLSLPESRIVALLGPNGAGKTTTLRVLAGLVRPRAGSVVFDGVDVTGLSPAERARKGICLIPEGRGVFPSLTVRENLRLHLPPWLKGGSLDPAIEAFPVLGERLNLPAGSLSGGQQQMLSVARAFLAGPSAVILDEVSMGLAPKVVDEIYRSIKKLAASGVSLLVVEQYVNRALDLADDVVLLDRGTVGFTGPASGLDQSTIVQSYLHHEPMAAC